MHSKGRSNMQTLDGKSIVRRYYEIEGYYNSKPSYKRVSRRKTLHILHEDPDLSNHFDETTGVWICANCGTRIIAMEKRQLRLRSWLHHKLRCKKTQYVWCTQMFTRWWHMKGKIPRGNGFWNVAKHQQGIWERKQYWCQCNSAEENCYSKASKESVKSSRYKHRGCQYCTIHVDRNCLSRTGNCQRDEGMFNKFLGSVTFRS